MTAQLHLPALDLSWALFKCDLPSTLETSTTTTNLDDVLSMWSKLLHEEASTCTIRNGFKTEDGLLLPLRSVGWVVNPVPKRTRNETKEAGGITYTLAVTLDDVLYITSH